MSCASTSGAFTRVPEEDKTIVYEIPYTVSAEQAYKLSRLWIAESFNSAKDVITFEDADLGVITGRFNTEAFFAIQPVTVWINFKITINEDISTLSFSNIAIGQGRIEYENQRNEIKRKTDALYSSYRGYLVK
jgi:hypothetical protein